MINKPTYEELQTRIKKLEREKLFEHARLMSILGTLPYGVYIIDAQFNIQYANSAIEKECGPYEGGKCFTYLYGRTDVCPWCKCDEVLAGKSVRWKRYFSKTNKYYELFEMPLVNSDGSISKFSIINDVTATNRAHEALKKNMRDLNERVKELNCFYGIATIVEKKGASLEDMYRGTVDLLPQSMQYPEKTCARIIIENNEFRTPNFKQTIWKQAADIIVHDTAHGALEVFLRKEVPENGEGIFLKEEIALIHAVAARLGRITERKMAQKALRKSEQRFRDLIENSPTGITIIQNGKVVYRNPAQKQLAGVLDDPSLSVTFENILADDAEMVEENYQKLVSGERQHADMEFRFFTADRAGDRSELKWAHCMANAIEYQGKGAVLINLKDITLTKKFEHTLRIQDKMTSLGRVAAGIAHEIRNPLSGINIYLDTLSKIDRDHEGDETASKIIAQIQSASNKIESVIKRVMDFSRPGEPKFVLTDINQPVMDAVNLSSVTLRKSGIQISTDLPALLPKCKADPHLIEQVILNLITNASEAMQRVDRNKLIQIASYLKNDAICITVCDSGPGVPENIMNNIFDPFFTTKTDSSGIGLSICHRIITDHGGSLHISTAAPGGAKFIITIPVNSQADNP